MRDAARADPQNRLADGHPGSLLRLRQGVHVQLLGEPAVLRSRGPGDAGSRRAGLLPAQAVRAHLPPPSPLPDHRGHRGDSNAPGGRVHVRLHASACAQGRERGLIDERGLAAALRRDPPGRPGEPGAMSREARVIGQARAAGLAVPEVLLSTEEPGLWGTAGLVMRRVAGETIARRILRDDAYRPARKVLVRQIAEFAAGLHALEVPGYLPESDPLAGLRAQLAAFGQVSPVFELALRTLEGGRPPARAPVIVHGDLRLGNLIVGPDSLLAVIDWELVHAGNPAEDLGWFCVKAWRFGVAAPAGGLGSREELLAAYRAAGGADITAEELRWWELLRARGGDGHCTTKG